MAKRGRIPKELPPGAKIRACMKCTKDFVSLHVGNRICEVCNKANRELSMTARCRGIHNAEPLPDLSPPGPEK
jgi:hypothetical protein